MKAHVFRSALLLVAFFASIVSPSLTVAHAATLKLAAATSTPYVVDSSQEATVNLYCRLKADRKTFSASGSGIIISERGVILTNAHVAQYFLLAREKGNVRGECSARTGSPAKKSYTAAILYIPPVWLEDNVSKKSERQPKGTGENDFALLYITGAQKKIPLPTHFPSLPVSVIATSSEGTPVTVAGYPTEDLDFKEIQNKLMAITVHSSVTDTKSFNQSGQPDMLTIASSSAASSGVSGGPLLSSEKNVVGIVALKGSAKDDRRLRGISIPYINRALFTQTGLSLPSLLAIDARR